MIASEKIGVFYKEEEDIDLKAEDIEKHYLQGNPKDKVNIPAWFVDEANFNKIINDKHEDVMPMMAEVIPSLACPFRCEECSYRPQKESMGIWNGKEKSHQILLMDKSTMEKSIEELDKARVKHIVFTGGGEPLSNKKILMHGIDMASEKQIEVCLYTNGLLLDDESISKIVEKVNICRISIYGCEPNGFFSYTKCKKENYDCIFNNICKLIDEKEKKNSKIQISLSFLLHPLMYDIERPIAFWSMLVDRMGLNRVKHITSVRFTPAVDYYNNNQIDKVFFDKIFQIVETEKNIAKENGVIFKAYKHRLNDLYLAKKYKECLGCGLYAEIGPDGSMYQCCEKLFIPEYKIGNINEMSIKQIYASKRRHEVLEYVKSTMSNCPCVCKPHEANKQLVNIQKESDLDKAFLLLWRSKLLGCTDSDNLLGQYNFYES